MPSPVCPPRANMPISTSEVRARALAEGFTAARICKPDAVPHVMDRLKTFIDNGYHSQMGWLADRMHWRGDPAALWPEAQSVVMLAESYTPDHNPLDILSLVDILNGIEDPVWGDYSTDIDRSGSLTPLDILALIDVLNGAGQLDAWNNTKLPSGCD